VDRLADPQFRDLADTFGEGRMGREWPPASSSTVKLVPHGGRDFVNDIRGVLPDEPGAPEKSRPSWAAAISFTKPGHIAIGPRAMPLAVSGNLATLNLRATLAGLLFRKADRWPPPDCV